MDQVRRGMESEGLRIASQPCRVSLGPLGARILPVKAPRVAATREHALRRGLILSPASLVDVYRISTTLLHPVIFTETRKAGVMTPHFLEEEAEVLHGPVLCPSYGTGLAFRSARIRIHPDPEERRSRKWLGDSSLEGLLTSVVLREE